MSSPFIISRSDGRIYVGLIDYMKASNGDIIAWADTDNPKRACAFDNQAVAEWWAERLTKAGLKDHTNILLASPLLRDFSVRRLDGAVWYEGHKLSRSIEVEEKPPE